MMAVEVRALMQTLIPLENVVICVLQTVIVIIMVIVVLIFPADIPAMEKNAGMTAAGEAAEPVRREMSARLAFVHQNAALILL